MKLRTTQGEFEACHAALDKLRSGSAQVKVPAAALRALLTDHSRLTAALRGEIQEG